MQDKILKYGFREGMFGKQILTVLVAGSNFTFCKYTCEETEHKYTNWRDATREESNEFLAKIKDINS